MTGAPPPTAAVKIPPAIPGNVQIVVPMQGITFVGWAPISDVEAIMDSFERRARIDRDRRHDRIDQMRVRIEIARLLRGPDAADRFTDVLAAGCLWLALRHWLNGAEMRSILDARMERSGSAVLTVCIADPTPETSMPDTAWAFVVSDRVDDRRKAFDGMPPDTAALLRG